MVSAFHKLCAEAPVGAQLYLIIVGDGKEEQSLKQQATQLGIREQIHFAGFQGKSDGMDANDGLPGAAFPHRRHPEHSA